MSYIAEKIKKLNKMITQYVPSDKLGVLKRGLILLDFAFAVMLYGVNIDEYFLYEFFSLRHVARKSYIVHRKRMKIINTCNPEDVRKVFDDKKKFLKMFSEFTQRPWLDVEQCSYNEFRELLEKENRLFAKPSIGFYGKGVRFVTFNENTQAEYDRLVEEKAIVEAVVHQHPKMEALHMQSLNTLRVVTLIGADGETRIMSACLRCGNKQNCADNFHHDGIAALIDISSGIVCTMGVDRYLNRYVNHPVSGAQIVGFQVPEWDNVVKTVLKAAQKLPAARYVGWDVAIASDGRIVIVEGNTGADPDVLQIPDGKGKWYSYKLALGL